MFCERCGCIMEDGTFTCPECGAYYGPTEREDPPSLRYLIVPFVLSASVMTAVSWLIGFYAILFLMFLWVGSRPHTKKQMMLKGVSLGLMAGCIIGLALRYLISC